jgi:hypothetical protein
MFNLVYTQQDLMKGVALVYDDKVTALMSFENRFGPAVSLQPEPDLSRMTPAELAQYSAMLTDIENEMLEFRSLTRLAEGVTKAAQNGAQNDEALFRMIGARPTEPSKDSVGH